MHSSAVTRRGFMSLSASVVAGAALAGCTGGQGSIGGNSTNGIRSITVATNTAPWLKAWQATAAAYTKKTGVQVNLQPIPNDQLVNQQLNDIQSGTHRFDVLQLDESYISHFNSNAWLRPLSDIDQSYQPDPATNSYSDVQWWNSAKNVTSKDGGRAMTVPLNGNVEIFGYRTDLYDKSGLKKPKTWDDVVANGTAIRKSGSTSYGYIVRTQGVHEGGSLSISWDFLPLLYTYGGDWIVEPGVDWTPAANSPEAIAAATMLRKLAALGPADTNTLGQTQVISAIQGGEAAQWQLAAGSVAGLLNKSDSKVADSVAFTPLPTAPGRERKVATGVFALGIPARISDERAKAALEFLKWSQSAEAQIVFAENGGIPTRNDVLDQIKVPEATMSYLRAVADSVHNAGPSIRYPFGPKLVGATEKYLSQIAAGALTPEAGMNQLQAVLVQIVKDANLPMAGGK